MTRSRHFVLGVGFSAAIASVAPALGERTLEFNRDIRPILSNKCFACHGPDEAKRQAGLRLDDAKVATTQLDSGAVAIVAGKPAASELVRRITDSDESLRMPPTDFGKSLSAGEITTLRDWIKQGAHYAPHWSYVKPERPEPPLAPEKWQKWTRNEIDLFALQEMREHGLEPSPEADRYALVRRVFLDVTGLPPTVEEVDAFVADADPHAYEKLVDDLLSRSSYGEHMARMWLDLARYADSAGYADDPPRTIWAYRDWVIRAFNDNKPFDQFTIEQIAGDLLPNPSDDQLIATAFHRNTLTNNEGGTQDEEFRNAAVVDRVNTTLAVWMGTTMACAQCHSHKYDPITQTEYFQVFAIFNNTRDADLRGEEPVLEVFSAKQHRRKSELLARTAQLQMFVGTPHNAQSRALTVWAHCESAIADLNPATTVPILRELTDRHRETHLEYRGNYLDKGPLVEPGVPAVFHPVAAGRPVDRLAMARWLVDENNPLTARVIANRYWEMFFGRGIVATSEEFGSQGEPPTHPELLDWIATELMRNGWDIKALVKTIVTSAVYRQSAQVSPIAARLDPDNRWLARGPRVRLSAEMVRDQALAAAGLLSRKMYGPPVHPPQPDLGLRAAFGGSTDWTTSRGSDRHRRAIYTSWRRSNPYPSMATFDAPNREVCTVRRNVTNTPLQSLVTLNDPVYMEAAQGLAREALRHTADSQEQIVYAFRRCVARPPSSEELQSLMELYRDSGARLAKNPQAAETLSTAPLGILPAGMDPVDAGAMTVVGNVLLNLDEIFLKR
jgi:hypothetical protein